MLVWLARLIERQPWIHAQLLRVWRSFPPRLAGFLKGQFARSWVVGAVAVMIDEDVSPPELLLVEHSYRSKGAWGLPGGSLDSIPGDPTQPISPSSQDDVLESALRRELTEELGIEITAVRLLRVDAIPYVKEEPGPYRLDFYFRCLPQQGFAKLREDLTSGRIKPRSPEISQMRLVPWSDLKTYDLYSSDSRLLREDLRRLEPGLMRLLPGETQTSVDSIDADLAGAFATPGGIESPAERRPL
jgi:8-oxo-dGTP pyrophosphatase MutT (NUDIX family)